MKISKLYLLLLIFPLFYTCKNEDETPVDPLATCCDIAALDATAGNGEIYAPNVFTPNNDGINDLFVIFTNQNITQVVFLEIKSECGDMSFTRHNY